MTHEEFYNSLSEDLKAKVKACKSHEEMLRVLEEADIKLDPALLQSVAGGSPDCLQLHCRENHCDIKLRDEGDNRYCTADVCTFHFGPDCTRDDCDLKLREA